MEGHLLGTLGTVFSVSGPTFAKKLLKLFAIAVGSSIIFPFTFSCDIVKLTDFLTLTIFLMPSHVFFMLVL